MFRVYYTWRNRCGTTHIDARTLDGAKALSALGYDCMMYYQMD